MRLIQYLGLTVLLLLSACMFGKKYPDIWQKMDVRAPTEDVLWEVALLSAIDEEFPLGAGIDPGTRIALTGWRTSLAPFKGKGFRERAHMRLEPQPDGSFSIFMMVEKEVNEDLARPMDPQYAKWEPAPNNLEAAQLLMAQIRARLGGSLEVGDPRKPRPISRP
jgi:hypothetical protein